MRLIDGDLLMKTVFNDLFLVDGEVKGVGIILAETVDKAPTIDAVPVVRCRECQHWKPSGSKAGNSFSDMEYIGGCEFTKYCRRESDFCSYGEKRRDKDGTT